MEYDNNHFIIASRAYSLHVLHEDLVDVAPNPEVHVAVLIVGAVVGDGLERHGRVVLLLEKHHPLRLGPPMRAAGLDVREEASPILDSIGEVLPLWHRCASRQRVCTPAG